MYWHMMLSHQGVRFGGAGLQGFADGSADEGMIPEEEGDTADWGQAWAALMYSFGVAGAYSLLASQVLHLYSPLWHQ